MDLVHILKTKSGGFVADGLDIEYERKRRVADLESDSKFCPRQMHGQVVVTEMGDTEEASVEEEIKGSLLNV